TDEEERAWVEPRLAHLLGLEERTARDQADLFSAWRLYFERIAERDPITMVFEDLQWADSALLDFIEYLLEWSRTVRCSSSRCRVPNSRLADRHGALGSGTSRRCISSRCRRRRWTNSCEASCRACPTSFA